MQVELENDDLIEFTKDMYIELMYEFEIIHEKLDYI